MSDMYQLSDDLKVRIDHWVAKYPPDRRQSAVISALSMAQEEQGGWLRTEVMDAVADYLDMPRIAVYEVASFYSMLETEPVGRHIVAFCANVSCMLRGADELIACAENKLGCKRGETTSDGRITLKMEEECIAACTGGPAVTVNGHYHENMTSDKVNELLDGLE